MRGPGDGGGAGAGPLAGLQGALSLDDVCDGQVEEETAWCHLFPVLTATGGLS